jgi:hypothetical protein
MAVLVDWNGEPDLWKTVHNFIVERCTGMVQTSW